MTVSLTTTATTNAVLTRIGRGSVDDTGSFTVSATCVGTPPPAISGIAPTSGPAAGGTSITINGSNFTGVGAVRFDSTDVTPTSVSATQITATAPAHAAGTVGIAVVKNGTASATFTGFTYVAAPAVTAVAPNSGGAGGGNSVTVTGTGFTNASAVSFGGSPASSYTVDSATQITATAPAGSGTVNVTVTTPGGTSATGAGNQYRYVAAPTISGISPAGGSSGGGTPVTITGTDFVSGNSYSASFGATTVPATYASATTLTATTPAGAGTVAVGVTDTTAGQASTGSVSYSFAAPTVTALSVTSGPANTPRSVVITGTNFTPTATVTIGGTAATGVSYVNATQLSATLPAKAAGTYDVQVTTGRVTSAAGPGSQYSYIAAPTITSATPGSGSTAGGTSVTITGTALTGASAVTFGGNAATSFTVTGDTQITAATPAGSAGATSIAVTTPGGTATLAGGYSYVVLNPPAVTGAPASQTVAVGATASFTASASGSPSPSVQWQVSSDSGASFTNIAGATAATYTTPATTASDNGRQYRAVFTNSQGSATSSAATLTVIQAPTANAQNVTAAFNTATAVTLTGTDPNTPARTLTYAVATQPAHGTLNGTLPNLTYTPAANYIGADSFTFTVSNGLATSSAATVTITVAGPPAPVAPVLTSPANGSTLNTATPIVTGVTASGTTVQIFIDGTLNGNATVSGTSFNYTVPTALSQGSHSVYAVASASGVPSPASNSNAFVVDTVPPATPVISAPANGATLANRRPTVTGSAENNASVAIRINGAAAGTVFATAGGTYSYTPSADLPLGSNTVSVTATDAAGNVSPNATNSFTIVALPTVSAVTPAEGGTAGGTTITVTGTNFTSGSTVTVGGTPATGVTIASATSLTAVTPAGTAGPATVQVTNTAGAGTVTGSFTYVGTPTAAAQTVSTAFQTARSVVLAGTDPNTPARPLSYAIAAAPARGTLSGTAPNLTYTPVAGARGTDSFTFTTSNGVSISAPATVTVTIGDPTLTIAAPPASGTVGTAYTATLTTTGGTAPYSYAVTAGALPAGLTLAAGGTLSGTPTSAGAFAFTVTAEDSTGGNPPVRQSQAFTITIGRGAQTVRFISTPPAGAIVGGTYLVAASASSGLTPVIAIDAGSQAVCSITGNSVRFDQVGTCVVTASQAGDTSFDPATPVQQSIAIGAPTIAVSPATVPASQVGVAYSQRFTASGGTAPYSFAVTAGTLPTGLTLATDGTLSGTPRAAGTFTYTIAATDSATGTGAPFVGQASYTTSVQPPVLALSPAANTSTPTALPAATGGTAYSQTITASGGTGPYGYAVVGGALPPGLTLATDGTLSGTPSAAGTFSLRIRATDSGGFTVEGLYGITVAAPAIVVTPATLPAASVGQPYDQTVTASGAGNSYSFAVIAGALPPGVTLTSDGRLTGTPSAGGSFTVTLRATNAAGFTGDRAYTLAVATATVALSPASLPAGVSGTAYSETLSATGGTAPYAYAVTAGALPAGVTLSSSGTLAGTPTQSGSFTFSVTATDSSTGSGPYSATRSYTLVIAAPALTLAPATLANATVGAAYSQALTASGGTAPYSYAVTAGALPAGVALGTNGTLSGMPTSGGSYSFTVTATDATTTGNGGPYTASRSYTLTVATATVALSPASLPAGVSGTAYSETLSATGGTAPYGYALTAGALPAGVTLSSAGVLAGTPTQSGSFTFSVTATDSSTGSGPYGATRSYTLSIAAPALVLDPATLANATVGSAYSQALTASGGTAPYSYAVTAGTLPAGVTLGVNGTLSGTPTAGGSYSFTVTATDATTTANGGPYTTSRSYTLTVATATVALSPASLPAGVSGAAYSETLSATGGTAPYAYAVTAGALPAGVTLSSSGTLAGTPTQSGSFTFSVTATDSSTGSGPYSATRSYTLVIAAPALTLAPTTLANATVGSAYSQALTASGGTAPYSYAVNAGALPSGVTLGTNGTLSGTPTAGGSYNFTVTATDATTAANGGPYTAARSYTLTVATATVALSPANLPAGTSGAAYSETLSATGGTAPYAYAVTAGTLPSGITLSSSGTLAGTPTQSGSFTFSITATDSSTGSGPYNATRSYTLVIAAPVLTLAPATLANATVGAAYSQTLTASGGTAPYSYAVTAGALPAGVTLGTNGTLSGMPTAGGSYNFTVTATDATTTTNGGPYTAARSYTLTVATATVALSPANLPAGTSGAAYSETLSATGGTAPYAYAVTAGALPAGVTLSSSGTLAGTPTQSGSLTFSVTATDSSTGSGPYSATRSYTLLIGAPALTLAPATLANGTVGAAYSQALTASGGTAPYSYSVTAGALPAGVTLGTNGTLSGTPTAGGSYSFTITATDATTTTNGGPYTAARSYVLTVATATVALSPANLPAGTSGVAYSETLSATGGTAPYGYAVAAGALPAGVTLASNGTLAGTPTQSGSFTFSVTATDSSTGSGPYSATRSYTLLIAAPALTLAPATLANATVGAAYRQALTASGGTVPYSYAITAGVLPAGVGLGTNGTLSGTPTAGGSYSFTITATDATATGNGGPYTASRSYTLTVATATVALSPASLPAGVSGAAYSETLSATGGTAPYAYAVTAGALPAGVTLSSSGTLAGTPTQSGSFTFSVTATDSSTGSGPYSAMRSYTLLIGAPALTLAPATLANGTVGAAYSQALTASGGTAPYSYAVTAGALPAGVTLGTNGTLSGTPTAGGSYSFTVTATDATTTSNGGPYTAARSYTLTVATATVALSPANLPAGTSGVAYSETLSATGGTAPYGYAVTAGALPAGVTLASNGTLVGTPTQSGSFTFSVTATDSSTGSGPYSATRSYTLAIAAPALTLAPATLANATVGAAYRQALTASGGTAPYSYAITAGVLPAGVTLGTNGTLSGTPTAGGSYSFTVTATDATITANGGPYTAARSYTLNVATATVALSPANLPAGTSGVAYSETLSATGGTAPYTYAVTAGALPAGVILSSSGTLSGTPTQSGSFTFSVTATDSSTGSGPYSATRSYTLVIAAPALTLAPATLVNATVGTTYSQALTASGGTAPYSYAVTAGVLPAGVTLGANGTLSGTPTAGGSYSFTVTATDATTTVNGGPYTASRGYTLTVVAASVVVGPANLPDGRYEVAYRQPFAASGGTAPYRLAVTGGALPAGLALAADGTLSGTPSAFGRFTFTVTATDSSTGAGPYSGATAYTLTIAAPDVPVAGDVTLSVGYGAAATAVPLKVSGGEATSVAIVTAPTHGTATVSGIEISYTPAAGYAGTDSFTYTASNAGGTSAPATVSITVAKPSLALTPATLPAGQENVAYSLQLTTTGGTAPYTYAVTAGRLPTGVALSAGGLLAGTPQESGRYTVTVTATDSSSGNGPFTATNVYTLDIALPAPPVARPGSAATDTATTAQNGAVTIDLSSLVTGDYREIRVVTQPQHGTVSIDRGQQGLVETSPRIVTATQNGIVAAVRQQAATATNQRVTATYTPEPGYIGEDSFGYVAIGDGGTSNEARVAITVKGSAPVAPAVKASVTNGQTQIVDLTAAAIGGPFIGATIVSVAPADGVEAVLVESGSVGDRRYQLRITPRGRFSGTATVRYTLTNAYGTSAPAAVSVSVVQRADPSLDPTVTGISAAQAEATRRFAQAQLDNFQRRNEQLHNGGASSVGRPLGISVAGGNSFGGRDPDPAKAAIDMAMLKSEHATEVMGRDRAAGLLAYDVDGRAMPVTGMAGARSDRAAGQTLAGNRAAPAEIGDVDAIEGSGRQVGSTAIWSGGAIALGTQDATRRRSKLTVTTGGLSSGIDVKLSETLIVGVGGGYGAERAEVGRNQGRVDSNSWMGAVYGSVAPADGLFVDGVAGAGRLSFDTIRNVTDTNLVARGHREGSMLFGSLTGGFDRTSATQALSAYGRIDYLSARLDRYTETGVGTANLMFDKRDLTSLSSVLGIRGSFVTGRFVPRLRAEWRHEFKNGGVQALDYADLGGFTYAIRGDEWTRDNYSVELGTDYVFDNSWRIGLNLGGALGQGSRYATETITIRKQF